MDFPDTPCFSGARDASPIPRRSASVRRFSAAAAAISEAAFLDAISSECLVVLTVAVATPTASAPTAAATATREPFSGTEDVLSGATCSPKSFSDGEVGFRDDERRTDMPGERGGLALRLRALPLTTTCSVEATPGCELKEGRRSDSPGERGELACRTDNPGERGGLALRLRALSLTTTSRRSKVWL